MIKYFRQKNKKLAFTLVEAMVAISVLMVAVVSPITIAQKGLSSAVYSKDQMIASYLAQDVLEYIKNIRDTKILQNTGEGLSWINSSLGDCLDNPYVQGVITKRCSIDTITREVSTSYYDLYINNSEDNFVYYTHKTTGNTKSKFSRDVNIRELSADEYLLTVRVSWDSGLSGNNVEVKTYIYNLDSNG